ncbi:hypothetical protein GCM10023322_64970 [Rugosimonospora acidiphila]|uniref:Secreted protein n=1 Tax=Rugosimonospora acidiphila TaxID=556531 RepID=A0ABP9SIB1_9ACTN
MNNKKLYVTGAAAVLISGLLLAAPLTGASAADKAPSTSTKVRPMAAPQTSTAGAAVSVAPGGNGLATVACPAGKIITGGGGQTSGFDIFFTDSYASGNGWTIRGTNKGTTAQSITPIAICIG